MDVVLIADDAPRKLEDVGYTKGKIRLISILNKFLFFLIGSSVTCIGSTGWLTSKAFQTHVFISQCYSVYFYVNLAAFLVVLLLIDCNYGKAVISGWLCVGFHLLYILIVALADGQLGKHLYISVYAGIAILEAFVIQSNSYVISKYYGSSVFSNMYSGYYGGMAIFSLIQTLAQYILRTDTAREARRCLIFTHASYGLIVLSAVIAQTFIYLNTRKLECHVNQKHSLVQSCLKKLRGMFRVLQCLPKYSSRFTVFIASDLCKCAFYQVFIPYRLLLTDTQLTIIFFMTNIFDIIGRSIASSADDTVVVSGPVSNHQKFLYRRDVGYLVTIALSWLFSFLIVFATWTLKMRFLTQFGTILVFTLAICFATGYCSTRGINGCIPVLEYFNRQTDRDGYKLFPDTELGGFSYVNDLNAFMIKFTWMFVFLAAYFLAAAMERHQATHWYQELSLLR